MASCVSLSCWPLWLTHQSGSEKFPCETCGSRCIDHTAAEELDSDSQRLHERETRYICVRDREM
uniref:Uncharacterized protein n=1 Tax=Anguilla anguilla TaxID=7936 RepID=A0A0E9PRT5_ANGAN